MLGMTPAGTCWVLIAFIAAPVLGCGRGVASAPTDIGTGTGSNATVTAILHPFGDSAAMGQRWRDIVGHAYSTAFQNTFEYTDSTVTVTFTPSHSIPQFTVTAPAHALKPNFCYQMKIMGPAEPWTDTPQVSNPTNYALGTHGRWWCDEEAWNVSDYGLSYHIGQTVRGYLYFAFFVTAADGSVRFTSGTTNAFHVTWKSSQRGRLATDGPARRFSIEPAAGWAYDEAKERTQISLFGEHEPERTLPGQMALPVGRYTGVEFRLTEESFHSPDPTEGGRWWTALASDPISFEVTR